MWKTAIDQKRIANHKKSIKKLQIELKEGEGILSRRITRYPPQKFKV